jgi:DNA-directed RNA polymerase subunit M/transcription elongation factor TFIIS
MTIDLRHYDEYNEARTKEREAYPSRADSRSLRLSELDMAGRCPRCDGAEVAELQRLRPAIENRVYRCRRCGHLWSPVEDVISTGIPRRVDTQQRYGRLKTE